MKSFKEYILEQNSNLGTFTWLIGESRSQDDYKKDMDKSWKIVKIGLDSYKSGVAQELVFNLHGLIDGEDEERGLRTFGTYQDKLSKNPIPESELKAILLSMVNQIVGKTFRGEELKKFFDDIEKKFKDKIRKIHKR